MSKSQNEIQIILNKLGRLPDNFDKNTILYLLDSKVDKIRYLVIKNLAKLSDLTLLNKYK